MKELDSILWTEGEVVRLGEYGLFKGPLSNNEVEGVVTRIVETSNFGALIVKPVGGDRVLVAW